MNYRRLKTPGACYFFTVVSYNRQKIFCYDKNPYLLKESLLAVKRRHPFTIDAFILMPDHLHCIWTLPSGDSDYSLRWMLIKGLFSRQCKKLNTGTPNNRIKKREQSVWQRRFWEHQIRNDKDFMQHMDYIHYNPVKHGLVKSAKEWPYSSLHRYIVAGIYPESWGRDASINFMDNIGRE
ncbi:transposase [soil metagenome]